MGWPFFAELWRRRKNREIHLFAKWPFWRHFARFLATLPGSPFFVNFGLLSSAKTSVEVDTRETLQNKGFWSHFASLYLFDPFWRFEKSFILRTCLEDNFFRMLLFCTVRCSNFCRNWVSKVKKTLGLQNRARFEKGIFRSLSAARANLTRGGCAAVPFFFVVFGSLSKWPCRSGVEGFSVFSGFFFDPVFENLKWSSSHPPSFSLGVFSLLFAFSFGLGATPHCTYVFRQLAFNPSYLLGVFGVFLEKHCFSPWKRVIWVHFSVSPFCVSLSFVLGFFHFSLWLSLSLYLSLYFSLSFFFLVFFFLVVLSLFLPSLFFCCFFLVLLLRFCFMRRTTSKYYIWKFGFHHLFCLFFCFVFQICSYLCFFHYLACVCWWTSMFPIFPSFGFRHCERLSFSLGPILIGEILVDVHETL